LLQAELEIFRSRQNARRRKDFLNLSNQVVAASAGLRFDDGNH